MEKDALRESLVNEGVEGDLATKLELYKFYLELSDRISDRRLKSNAFFLTINSTLAGLAGYNPGNAWMIPIVGMAFCCMWYQLVKSYKDLNSAKFKVVHN